MPASGHRLFPALLSTLLFAVACNNAGHSGAWGGSVDTLASGRVMVSNPDTPLWQPNERWQLQERFRLGSSEPDSPELFGEIVDVEIGPGGEIYVLDSQAHQVRSFDRDGQFLRSFGRSGAGPGELGWPGGMALDASGTLWVVDFGNRRFEGFNPTSGQVVAERRRDWGYFVIPWPGGIDQRNHLIDVGSAGRTSLILRLDSSFTPVDSLVQPQPSDNQLITYSLNGLPQMSAPDPFAPRPAWALLPEGDIISGNGERYRLNRISFNGDTTATIEIQRRPVAVTASEKDSALKAFQELVEKYVGEAVPDREPRVPANHPAHGRIFTDDKGYIWVAHSNSNEWDVIDPDGRFLGIITLPQVPISATTPRVRSNLLAMATEVDDIPMVIVYEISRR